MIDPLTYLKTMAEVTPNIRLAKALEKLEVRRKSDELRAEISGTGARDINARTARNLRSIADRLEGKI